MKLMKGKSSMRSLEILGIQSCVAWGWRDGWVLYLCFISVCFIFVVTQGLLLALPQESLLVDLGVGYEMLGTKPGLTACKTNALPTVLLLQPSVTFLKESPDCFNVQSP